MGGEAGRVHALPLLPAGEDLFSNLPARAIVLDALAPALGDGVITVIDSEGMAVLVVRDGAITDVVSIVGCVRETGEAAMARVRTWESASISCSRLSVDAMSLLGPLLHGELVYSDLRLEWISWSQLLDDLRRRGQTFVVELQAPLERGVTVIRSGEQVATYSDSQPTLGDPELLDVLAAGGNGSISVLAESAAPTWMDSPPAAAHSSAPTPKQVPLPPSFVEIITPAVSDATDDDADDDDANATLSSLFGVPSDTQLFAPTIVPNRWDPIVVGDVATLLPQLKFVARQRLQRSAAPVEDAVDRAVDEHRDLGWLVAHVRVMRVRGFMPETFERMADEMQALGRHT